MNTDNIRILQMGDRRFLFFPRYELPDEAKLFYNKRVIDILIEVSENPFRSPILYVPLDLRCGQGNPIHLNKPADAKLAHRWKMACVFPVGAWDWNVYQPAALLNFVDDFFAELPYAP